MTHDAKRNERGELITHDAAGKQKDYNTWLELDRDAWKKKGEVAPYDRQSGVSPGTANVLGALGVQVGADGRLQISGGSSNDKDPTVFMGWDTDPHQGGRGSITGKGPEKTIKYSEYLETFYDMSEAELRAFQQKLYDAGYYVDENGDPVEPDWGDFSDPVAQEMWAQSGMRSAENYKAGKRLSPDAAIKPNPAAAKKKKERAPFQATTTNPTEMRERLREMAPEMMGRYLSDEEVEQMVAMFNQIEVQKQREAYELEGSGDPESVGKEGVIQQAPSFDAWASSEIRKRRPEETFAKDVNNRYQDFLSLLGAGGI
jgi:hypothetical protein